jgi:hypothetical protein
MWSGGFGFFAAEGATVTMGTVMAQSAGVALASRASVSMINNKFDLTKVTHDLTSKESLFNLGVSTLTAGLTHGIGSKLDIGSLKPGMDLSQRAVIVGKNAGVGLAVRSALSSGSGEKIGNILKAETLSSGLALGQSVIGDIAIKKDIKNGSLTKIAMHSALGSVYSGLSGTNPISGAIGGATSEIVVRVMESGNGLNSPPLTKEQRHDLNNKIKATTKLTTATVSLLAGGKTEDINNAVTVGDSAIEHNFIQHIIKGLIKNPKLLKKSTDIGKKTTSSTAKNTKKTINSGKAVEITKGKKVSKDRNNNKIRQNVVKNKKSDTKKIHKNSHEYVGESHVYKIRDRTKNKTHKVGESSGGVRVRDGKSKRAEAQVRRLERDTGEKFESDIIHNFSRKKDSYKHEGELIKRYREIFKDKKDILPGNKGNH